MDLEEPIDNTIDVSVDVWSEACHPDIPFRLGHGQKHLFRAKKEEDEEWRENLREDVDEEEKHDKVSSIELWVKKVKQEVVEDVSCTN